METGFKITLDKDRKSSDSDSNQMEGIDEKPYNCTPSSGNDENHNVNGFYAVDSRKMELLDQRMRGFQNMKEKEPTDNADISATNEINDFEYEIPMKSNDSDEVTKESLSSASDAKQKKKRKNYTASEDAKILEGVKKFGTDWDEIVKWSNIERTPIQIKDRYRRISKKKEDEPNLKKRKVSDEMGRGKDDSQPSSQQQTTTTTTSTTMTTPNNNSQQSSLKGPPSPEMGAIISQIEKERKTFEEEKERIRKKEQQFIEKEEFLRKWELQIQQSQQQSKEQQEDKTEKLRKVLIQSLQKEATQEREVSRKRLLQECDRLGQISYERHGTSYVEIWQDGQIFKEVAQKFKALQDSKEQLEKAKKEISKKIKKKSAAENNTENMAEIEDFLLQEEIHKIRIQNLKKEETERNMEKERLVVEKNLHIRELKRVRDEDQSRFNTHPVLKGRYVLLKLLGKGGFSEVFKAYDVVELREVACKIHQLNTLWSDRKKENYIKHAIREYNIHKQMVHSKIVCLFDVFEIDENSFCTVLEYCNGPDLDLYLKLQPTLNEREARSIILQIFHGLKYLNEQKRPIIHYDLKPGNILFSNGEVKITDFGLSKIMEEDQDMMELTSQGAGTYWYLPPECFEVFEGRGAPKISSKVDVWSVGVIFFQMLFGKKPFGNNLSQQKILQDNIIINSTLEFPQKPPVTKEAKDFIKKLLARSPDDRPEAKAALNDPYLKLPLKKDKKT